MRMKISIFSLFVIFLLYLQVPVRKMALAGFKDKVASRKKVRWCVM